MVFSDAITWRFRIPGQQSVFNAKQNHRLAGADYYEEARLHQNTVNGSFPGGCNGPPKKSGKPIPDALAQFD
jgi:hypothetical protein